MADRRQNIEKVLKKIKLKKGTQFVKKDVLNVIESLPVEFDKRDDNIDIHADVSKNLTITCAKESSLKIEEELISPKIFIKRSLPRVTIVPDGELPVSPIKYDGGGALEWCDITEMEILNTGGDVVGGSEISQTEKTVSTVSMSIVNSRVLSSMDSLPSEISEILSETKNEDDDISVKVLPSETVSTACPTMVHDPIVSIVSQIGSSLATVPIVSHAVPIVSHAVTIVSHAVTANSSATDSLTALSNDTTKDATISSSATDSQVVVVTKKAISATEVAIVTGSQTPLVTTDSHVAMVSSEPISATEVVKVTSLLCTDDVLQSSSSITKSQLAATTNSKTDVSATQVAIVTSLQTTILPTYPQVSSVTSTTLLPTDGGTDGGTTACAQGTIMSVSHGVTINSLKTTLSVPEVATTSSAPEVAVTTTSLAPEVASTSSAPEVAVTTTSLAPEVASTSSSPEVAVTTTSSAPEVASTSSAPEVAVTTTSSAPEVAVATTSLAH